MHGLHQVAKKWLMTIDVSLESSSATTWMFFSQIGSLWA